MRNVFEFRTDFSLPKTVHSAGESVSIVKNASDEAAVSAFKNGTSEFLLHFLPVTGESEECERLLRNQHGGVSQGCGLMAVMFPVGPKADVVARDPVLAQPIHNGFILDPVPPVSRSDLHVGKGFTNIVQ